MLKRLQSFFFVNSSTRQTIAKNTFWLGFGIIGSRIIRAGFIIYAARILGTDEYGIFSYMLSIAAFFSIFSDIGITAVFTREASKYPDKLREYFATSFFIKLVLVGPTIGIMLLAIPIIAKIESAESLIPAIVFLIIFDSFRNLALGIARSKNRMEIETVVMIATDIFIAACGLIALAMSAYSFGITIGYVAGSGLGMIAAMWLLAPDLRKTISFAQKSLIKPILSSAWPFAISGILGGFMINIDTIIIGIFRTTSELGLYGAAQRPIQFIYIIPALLSGSLFPIWSALVHEKNHKKFRMLLEKSLALALMLGLPIMIGGVIVGESFMSLLFGEAFSESTVAFKTLLFTIPPMFSIAILANAVFAYDGQRLFIISSSIGAALNVILDLLLIPVYGIEGSAIATVISLLGACALIWRGMKKINYFSISHFMLKSIIATLIMGCVTYALSLTTLPVLAVIGLSAIAYGLTLLALREPLIREVRALTHA